MPPIGARARAAVALALETEDLAPLIQSAAAVGPTDPLCTAVVALRVGTGTELLARRLLPHSPLPVVPGAVALADTLAVLTLARIAAGHGTPRAPADDAAILARLAHLARSSPDLLDEVALAAALSVRQRPASWQRAAAALVAARSTLASLDAAPQPPAASHALADAWNRLRGVKVGRPAGPLRVAIARGLPHPPRRSPAGLPHPPDGV